MAIFIDGLAFGAGGLDTAKTAVLFGSAASSLLGIALLLWMLPQPKIEPEPAER